MKRKPDLTEWWEEETPVGDVIILGKWCFTCYSLWLAGERDYKEDVTLLVCIYVGNALLVSLHGIHAYYVLELFRFFLYVGIKEYLTKDKFLTGNLKCFCSPAPL